MLADRVLRRRVPPMLLLLLLAGTTGPAGAASRSLKLRFPSMEIPAGANVEACVFLHFPRTEPFDVGSWLIEMRGIKGPFVPQHFLIYQYTGDRLAEFAQEAGRVIPGRGCLGLGPEDRDRRQLVVSGAGMRVRGVMPPGLALRLAPSPGTPGGAPQGIGILLDLEWINADTKPRKGSARVTLVAPKRNTVRRLVQPILEETAGQGLLVAPDVVGSTEASTAALNAARPGEPALRDAWGAGIAVRGTPAPAGDACVTSITGHYHKRAVFFGVDLLGTDGLARNPADGPTNPYAPGRRHLFAATDYTDPGTLAPFPPQLVRAGESLHYACWYDNGRANVIRRGCEVTDGVAPGTPAGLPGGGPARVCRIGGVNPTECPPAEGFTGRCVEANLVGGTALDDEVCQLAGFYYDAVPGAAPGAECDVGALPVIQ